MRIYTKAVLTTLMLLVVGHIAGATVEVNTVEGLILKIHELSDGDTLLVKSGTYNVTPDLAPDGLYVAGKDFTPYADVVILGEGREQTIIDFGDSYGFLACFCDNLTFKSLTIKNATINGGIYVFQGSISADDIVIRDCKSISTLDKGLGHGGAISVDETSSIKAITNSVFYNNTAAENGGAIAFMGTGTTYAYYPKIDQCQFYNNTAKKGGALYVPKIRKTFYVWRNVFFNNLSNDAALYLNATSNVYFKNNSVVNNQADGIELGTSLRERFYFDNNAVVNNSGIDCVGAYTAGNRFRGWYNVVGSSNGVIYDGSFNDIISGSRPFYNVVNDSLKLTTYGAGLLAGRVPNNKKMSADIYGESWSGIGDVGALKVPLGDSISVWYGSSSDFSNSSNWKGTVPTAGSTKKIIVSNCLTTYHPELKKGDNIIVPDADLYIAATGAMKLLGDLSVDTLYLESQNGGTAQFLNKGALMASARLSEKFLENELTAPVYFPDTVTIVGSVLPNARYVDDFHAQVFNEQDLTYTPMLATDTFFQDQGYWVRSYKNQTMSFALPDEPKELFDLQYTYGMIDSEAGWNVVGNPYGAPLISEHMMTNPGNSSQVASAVYSFSEGHFKAYVDSVGDVEAKVVMPYKAFYLKALAGANTFKLDTGDIAIVTSEGIADVSLRSEMLKVGLSDHLGDLVDKTYIRFKNSSTDQFDNASDAYKLDCMFGLGSEYLYTTLPGADDVYAINTLPIQDKQIKSILLKMMVQSSVIKTSPSRTLSFDISDDAEVEYLLHDSEKDSSESVILSDGFEYTFNMGTDSAYLSQRFSLQIFEDTIPHGVVGVTDYNRQGYILRQRQEVASIEEIEVTSTMLESIALFDNPDTIFYEQLWVDTTFYDSISYQINFHDSIAIDSAISDTSRVLGTYEYIVSHVSRVNTRYTTSDTVYLDTIYDLIRLNEYLQFDTALVSSNVELQAQDIVEVISLDGALSIRFPHGDPTMVEVYDLSGVMLRQVEIFSQGDISHLNSGIYVLNMYNTKEHWSCKVLVK